VLSHSNISLAKKLQSASPRLPNERVRLRVPGFEGGGRGLVSI
jgi:hypothetical protein